MSPHSFKRLVGLWCLCFFALACICSGAVKSDNKPMDTHGYLLAVGFWSAVIALGLWGTFW